MNSRVRKEPSTRPLETFTHVERVGPTHAKELAHLAGVAIHVRQGEPLDALPVDFELSCGPVRLGAFPEYAISLRCCYVNLVTYNCAVKPHSHYEFSLSQGTYKKEETAREESSSKKSLSLCLDGSATGGSTSTKATARLLSAIGLGKSSEKKAQQTEKRLPKVDLIVTSGQDRWRVGDAVLGDARRDDGRLMGSYFGERRDSDGNPHPLCTLTRTKVGDAVQATISVTVSITDLLIAPIERGLEAQVRDVVRQDLSRKSGRAERDHTDELKARVAGLVAGKALIDAQRHAEIPAPPGEITVSLVTLLFPLSAHPAGEGG